MATKVRIYKPARTATQSGRAKTHQWVLEFDVADRRFVEPLMGWTGAAGTNGQLQLRFTSKDTAIAFAEKHGLQYDLEEPNPQRRVLRAYADNFAYTRLR